MRRRTAALSGALALGLFSSALAQDGNSGTNGILQLPSFSAFGVNTTVVVPDSGPSPLARQRQAYYSRFTPGGIAAGRGVGIDRRDAGASVQAQVHDRLAADATVLANVRARRANITRKSLEQRVSRRPPAVENALKSVAEIKAERAAAAANNQQEARTLFERAKKARAAGKNNVADIYFGMAKRVATGDLMSEIDAAIRAAAEAPGRDQPMPMRVAVE